MQTFYDALKEYCLEYGQNRKSTHTDRLRQIYLIARSSGMAAFNEQNIVAVASRINQFLDYRRDNGKEFLRNRGCFSNN